MIPYPVPVGGGDAPPVAPEAGPAAEAGESGAGAYGSEAGQPAQGTHEAGQEPLERDLGSDDFWGGQVRRSCSVWGPRARTQPPLPIWCWGEERRPAPATRVLLVKGWVPACFATNSSDSNGTSTRLQWVSKPQ